MSLADLSAMLNASKARGGSANLNLGGGVGGGRGAAASASGAPASAASPAELKQHADHMWRFLDDLASSDPEGYKSFMASQMQEMAAEKAKAAETEALFTPQPAFVIYTRQTSGAKGGERTVYINLCTSPQIPPLQTKDQKGPADPLERDMNRILIPLSVGAIKSDTDKQRGEVWTADIVFNPAVMSRALSGGDMAFKMFCIELALQHLEQDEKCTLHRAYKLIPPTEATYIGGGAAGRPAQQKTEAELAREKFLAQMRAEREEKIKSMATKSSKEIVMPSLSKTQQAKQEYEEQTIKELKLRPEAAASAAAGGSAAAAGGKGAPSAAAKQQKRVLIEDLTPDQGEDPSLTADAAPTSAATVAAAKPQAASASSSLSAAKPAITLASSTKLNSASSASSSSTAAASSSSAAVPAASSSSSSSSAASSSSAKSASSSDDGAWSSKLSSAISSTDFLSSLAAIPLEDSPSPWPYGSSAASMSSTSSVATVSAAEVAQRQRVQPSHTLSVSAEGQLELAIQLPLVNSVGELDVDVSRTQLQLTSDHYALTITFPGPIFEERSAAKFVKKQHTLKISAPMR